VQVTGHLPVSDAGIRVRQLRHADAEEFARGTEDPAVQQFAHLPLANYSPEIVREQIDGVIAQGLADGSLAVLAIADEESDRFLGSVVLFDPHEDRAEVGFWLTPEARGRGAAAAAVRAIGSLAAKAGLSWLEARTSPENVASRRVLEACGFEQRGGVTEQETPSGEVAQVIEFEAPVSRFVRGQG